MRTVPERLDAGQSLLDRQVMDADGHLVCKVDDIELEERAGELHLTHILEGPGALGQRLGEPFGRWLTAIWSRLSSRRDPGRIPMSDVVAIDSAVHVAEVPSGSGSQGFEQWMREHVVGRLPGALDDVS
jgi:sporulation protein YlmC with PRC-barrel domain